MTTRNVTLYDAHGRAVVLRRTIGFQPQTLVVPQSDEPSGAGGSMMGDFSPVYNLSGDEIHTSTSATRRNGEAP